MSDTLSIIKEALEEHVPPDIMSLVIHHSMKISQLGATLATELAVHKARLNMQMQIYMVENEEKTLKRWKNSSTLTSYFLNGLFHEEYATLVTMEFYMQLIRDRITMYNTILSYNKTIK